MTDFKQVVVINSSVEMSKGKMMAQACHASLKAYEKAEESARKNWKNEGEKKIMLKSGSKTLDQIFKESRRNSLPVSIVKDAGLTELEPGTKTAVGIGPAESGKIDNITGELELIE